MTDDELSTRMRAAREFLIGEVQRSKRGSLPGVLPAIGLLLVGALVGGAASAAVAVAVNTPTAAPAVEPLPAPVFGEDLPGTPIVSVVGDAQVFTLAESSSFAIDSPVGATAVRVRLSCVTEGGLTVSSPTHGTELRSGCADAVLGGAYAGGYGFSPLEATVQFDVVSDGTAGSLSVQFVREVTTPWGRNAQGQTYGVVSHGYPDLLAVIGSDDSGRPVVGYVPSTYAVRPPTEQAAAWKRELLERYPDGTVPVTTPDGATVLGGYSVDEDANAPWLDILWEQLHARYPDAQRPDAQTNESFLPSEWPAAMIACLTAAGFPEATIASDGQVDVHAEGEAAELATYTCWESHPLTTYPSVMGP